MPERALWTSDEVAAATGGVPFGASFAASGVAFDSREVTAGDVFVALAGARDGHDFAEGAIASGAAGVLTSRPTRAERGVRVPDTLRALEAMAVSARERSPARAAITGSVGKTSVTQAVLAGLVQAGAAHGPIKSFNNHIGVPLTLARTPHGTARAVFELGMNNPGEISHLSRLVAPQVAAITAVGAVHTENFADGEAGVARAKAEIFEGLTPGGWAVLNADDPWFDLCARAARARGARALSFGSGSECDAQLLAVDESAAGLRVVATLFGAPAVFALRQKGRHWGLNTLCVALVLDRLGVGVEIARNALERFEPITGRGAERTVALDGGGLMTLIDESYNANPMSMAAALATLAGRSGRRVAVLTDMLELGHDSARRHAELADRIDAAGIDIVFAAGPMMRILYEALAPGRRGAWAADAAALTPVVLEAMRSGDVVMVKGSNGSRAAVVAQALINRALVADASAACGWRPVETAG